MHIDHPMIPLTTPLMHGMCEGAKIEIDGMPYMGPQHGFTIELLTAHGSILHFDVRFQHHTIVMNNFHDGHWHCEERFALPFCIGSHFHLKLKNHPGHFAIHVNGMHVAHFHHRGNPHHITAFHIRGDVAVHKICYHNFSHPVVCTPAPVVMAPPPVVVAPPVVVPPPVYVPPPPVMVATAPAVVVVDDHHHHHHGGAAAVAGVAAGAIVGTAVLGAALRHGHRRHW